MQRITTTLMTCLTFMIFTTGLATAATITVRADSWPPYNDEPKSSKPGYMIEIIEEIFSSQGHEIDYQLMPWPRSLDSVRKGNYDAVVGTDPAESPDFVYPANPLGVSHNGFYVKKGSTWKYAGIDSLKQVRLGIIDGYGYTPALDKYIEENKGRKIFAATGDAALPQLLKMLKAGRLDVVLENSSVMSHNLQENQLTNDIINAGLAEQKLDIFMAFSPAKESSKEYRRIFDEGLVELRDNGKLRKILSRYGLKDWR